MKSLDMLEARAKGSNDRIPMNIVHGLKRNQFSLLREIEILLILSECLT